MKKQTKQEVVAEKVKVKESVKNNCKIRHLGTVNDVDNDDVDDIMQVIKTSSASGTELVPTVATEKEDLKWSASVEVGSEARAAERLEREDVSSLPRLRSSPKKELPNAGNGRTVRCYFPRLSSALKLKRKVCKDLTRLRSPGCSRMIYFSA